MYILGALSLIQILFLPGFIILKFISGVKGLIQKIVYAFALSLIFNHLVVVILTHLRINKPVLHYLLFGVELTAAIYLYWSDIKRPLSSWVSDLYGGFIKKLQSLVGFEGSQSTVQSVLKNIIVAVFLGWSIYSILWAFSLFISKIGSVFTIWDSVVSWNHWAVEWFSNSHPLDTKRYAQLIPSNFSVTYSFMQTDKIQFFAIGFMPLFAVYLLLLMFDLGLKKKEYGYLIGIVVTQYLLKRFYLDLIGSGYVDVALMFFTFLTVYTLLIGTTQNGQRHLQNTAMVGFVFAAGTALTKQNGLWVFAVYPILAYWVIFRRMETKSTQERLLLLVKYFSLAMALLLPWYIFNEMRIITGARSNELLLISQEHHFGRTLGERLLKAWKDLSVYAYLFPFVLLTLPFIKRDERTIIGLILIPYSLIWAFFFSLYPRNLSIGFALLGFASGIGAAWLIDFVLGLVGKLAINRWPNWFIVICLILIVLAPAAILSDQILLDMQNERQRSALEPEVNQRLYDYFDEQGDLEAIFTNYPLRFLPGFEDLQVNIGGFEDYEFYLQKRAEHPAVEYMLISLYKNNQKVVGEVYEGVDAGLFEIIFKYEKYLFVKILDQ